MATPLGKYKKVKLELKMKALDAIILDVWKPPGMSRWCMHGDDDHLAWKRPVFLEACRGLRTVGGLIASGLPFNIFDRHSLWSFLYLVSYLTSQTRDQIKGMDSKIVTVDQFAMVMASIQEAIASLSRMIDGQQVSPQDGAQYDPTVPPPPPPSQSAPQAIPFTLHSQTEVAPPSVTVPTPTSEDPHARMDRLEQRLRMPKIERYIGIGCPHIHLRLYSMIMRAHGLDEAKTIMIFPMSLSGAAQRWFASLDVSHRRTWDDLAQEFLRQHAFNTVIDVSRKELKALRQRPEESVTSFIPRWRKKISQALYNIEKGIARGLWSESSLSDSNGKKPLGGQRSGDVSAISSIGLRPPRCYQTTYVPPALALPHHTAQGIKRPFVSYSATTQPCYVAQFVVRPTTSYPKPRAQQTSAPFALRTQRQFSQLGMSLSQALRKLTETELLTALTPRPPPQPIPPQFRMDLHYAYHQGPGHETDRCTALRHAI
ncbi:hypothetical protein CK203_098518 [Vitis vinifera]|uniref:Retrotransposon gag domain-containing protein n=1 Tax=Vitis vinifera TaxID=29760 RepID=A0A438BXM5_VITVI|nr:hypothetical protein CK203_098518 [Vitis vinifera]